MRVTALLGAAALALLTGCTAGSATPSTAPAPPVVTGTEVGTATEPTPVPSSPTLDPTEAEILRVYAEFWAAQARSMKDPTKRPDPGLDGTAQGSALNDALATIVANRRDGLAMTGAPVPASRIAKLDVDAGAAVIVDCLDISEWRTVSTKTGKPVRSSSPLMELVVSAHAVRSAESWKLDQVTLLRDKTC